MAISLLFKKTVALASLNDFSATRVNKKITLASETYERMSANVLITYQFLPPAKSRQGKVILQAPLQST
jgi:hypothetical protein